MSTKRIEKKIAFSKLPPQWPDDLLPLIQQKIRESQQTIVVLDDDPTGTQTVFNVPVLTDWSLNVLQAEFERGTPFFYVLTDSRCLPLEKAKELNALIGKNLKTASETSNRKFVVVSRSDSTLRGHYPGEVDALCSALGETYDAHLIAPFFLEGGRFTIDDIHYVQEGEWLIPAAETPFAQDSYFGYRHSNLQEWVQEKTFGAVRAEDIASITLDDIRKGGPKEVENKLMQLDKGAVCVVNAITLRDMEVVVYAILAAEVRGKRFLYRTAASFAQVRAGIPPHSLLTKKDLVHYRGSGGLFVVGSYVPRSTEQLHALLEQTAVVAFEVQVKSLLDDQNQNNEIKRVARQATESLSAGKDVVIYTSRQLVKSDTPAHDLEIGQLISESLVSIVNDIALRPDYIVAKGGITSSKVATDALNIKRALVLGQILPGIPVWKAGEESRFPGLPYIVFPGNVGATDAMVQVVNKLGMSN